VLHVEECGNPKGQPVLVVHGGPGGGINPAMRRFHDPAHYRIILFDQRGCGRSTPYASLADNTTGHLIADIEAIREKLGLDRWQLFGGSWGSTLSLAYAEAYPERVSSLILRGIFLVTKAELAWFYQEGCSYLFPEAFEDFIHPIPEAERGDLMAAYHRRLMGPDAEARLEAARAWSRWEGATLSLLPDGERVRRFGNDRYALAFALIENHYFVNAGFFRRDGELLLEAGRLSGIPGTIVQGRYDVVTPVQSAWRLHQAWPGSRLVVVEDAGHAMTEPGIARALIEATRQHAHVQGQAV
jgi:proline iminopeptidase